MRIFVILGLMLLVVIGADAQKKPKINKAKSYWDQGELAEAKSILDAATIHEKTKDNGKTWYYRGLVYASIDTTANPDYQALSDDPITVAIESFNKAEELSDKEGAYYITQANGIPLLLNQQIDTWYTYHFNQAVTNYEAEDFEGAIESFVSASKVIPEDTNCLANAGYSALALDENEKALKFFEMNMERGARGKNMMLNIIQIYQQMEDLESALAAVRKAKEFYPNDNILNRQEVDILRKLGKLDEARDQLKLAIEKEPDQPLLPFFLGVLFDEDKKYDEALEWYNRAIEVDPEYYDAHFNKSAILYNKGTELQKEMNLLDPYKKADKQRAKELTPKIKETFANAIPAWESLYELKPDNRDVVERLIYMYDLTGQTKKADVLEKKLADMPEVEE